MKPLFIPEYEWLLNECRKKPTEVELGLINLLYDQLDENYTVFYHPHYDVPSSEIAIMNADGGVLLLLINEDDINSLPKDERLFVTAYKHKWKMHNVSIKMLLEKNRKVDFIKCGVYFGKAQFREVESWYKCPDSNHQLFCKTEVEKNRPKVWFWGMDDTATLIEGIKGCLSRNRNFTPEMKKECLRILGPSFMFREENRKVYVARPDSNRAKYAISQSGLKQQIVGEAGSGKTLLLAKRALECYLRIRKENRIEPICIFTFNITLRNYIYSQLAGLALTELEKTVAWELEENIQIVHYDKFLRDLLDGRNVEQAEISIGIKQEMRELGILDEEYDFDILRTAWIKKIRELNNQEPFKPFAAVLIDEAQDYQEDWIKLLTDIFVGEETEMLVTFDEKQDVYGNHESKKDKRPTIPKVINKRPAKLTGSFRLSKSITHLADHYQRWYWKEKYQDIGVRYNPDKGRQGQDLLLDQFSHVDYYWFNHEFSADDAFRTINDLTVKYGVHNGDIVVLALNDKELRDVYDTMVSGWEIEPQMMCITNAEKRQIDEVCANDKEKKSKTEDVERQKKYDFKIASDDPKVCTIKSFKGWEIPTVFLIITERDDKYTGDEQVYTGITRAMQNLIILNFRNEYYDEFFSKKIPELKKLYEQDL